LIVPSAPAAWISFLLGILAHAVTLASHGE
jgi:hypothetical protein